MYFYLITAVCTVIHSLITMKITPNIETHPALLFVTIAYAPLTLLFSAAIKAIFDWFAPNGFFFDVRPPNLYSSKWYVSTSRTTTGSVRFTRQYDSDCLHWFLCRSVHVSSYFSSDVIIPGRDRLRSILTRLNSCCYRKCRWCNSNVRSKISNGELSTGVIKSIVTTVADTNIFPFITSITITVLAIFVSYKSTKYKHFNNCASYSIKLVSKFELYLKLSTFWAQL